MQDDMRAHRNLVVRPEDFDVNDPALADDPWDAFSQLREACPVFHSDRVGWVLTKHADVQAAARDHRVFRSDWGPKGLTVNNVPRTREEDEDVRFSYATFPLLPIETDPPVHTKYRSLLQKFFTAPRVEKNFGDELRALAKELVGSFVAKGGGNFAHDVAEPMSGLAIAAALGIRPEHREEFQEKSLRLTGSDISEVFEFLDARIAEAEVGAFNVLREAEVDGSPLSTEEKRGYAMILTHAGWETTAAVLTTMALRLATQPELHEQLRADPGLLDTAADEFLRIDSSTAALWRTAGEDTEVRGCPIKRGDKVALLWGGANRDPDVFDSPDEVRLDRKPNRHLAFGDGVHRCLGAGLAIFEIRAILNELVQAPQFVVDGEINRVAGPVPIIRSLPLAVANRGTEL